MQTDLLQLSLESFISRSTIAKSSQTSPQVKLEDETLCRNWELTIEARTVSLTDRAIQTEFDEEDITSNTVETETQSLSQYALFNNRSVRNKFKHTNIYSSKNVAFSQKGNSFVRKSQYFQEQLNKPHRKFAVALPKASSIQSDSRDVESPELSDNTDASSAFTKEKNGSRISKVLEFWSSVQAKPEKYEPNPGPVPDISQIRSKHDRKTKARKGQAAIVSCKKSRSPITNKSAKNNQRPFKKQVCSSQLKQSFNSHSKKELPATPQSSTHTCETPVRSSQSTNVSVEATVSPPAIKYESVQPTKKMVKLWSKVISNHQQDATHTKWVLSGGLSKSRQTKPEKTSSLDKNSFGETAQIDKTRNSREKSAAVTKEKQELEDNFHPLKVSKEDTHLERQATGDTKVFETVLRQPVVYKGKRHSLPPNVQLGR